MTPKKTIDEVRTVIEDLGIEIDDGESALFAIGRLDVMASSIAEFYSLDSKITQAALPPDVLRAAAKREKSKKRAKLLRIAARAASDLLSIAEEVSYGDLHAGGVRRAERLRSRLYDVLYDEWLESFRDENEG
jgi:hypothetical protein